MNRFLRIFMVWFFAVMALWGFANLPRDGGTHKSFLEWAGFPWTFAHWAHGRLGWFSATALLLDVLVGLLLGGAAGLVCASTRCTLNTHLARDNPGTAPGENVAHQPPNEPSDAPKSPNGAL